MGAGVRAGAGIRCLAWSSREGLLANRIQHVDDLGKTKQHDTAQKTGKERPQTKGPADFVFHVERPAEEEDGQYNGGATEAVEHDGEPGRMVCRQVVHVFIGKLCHGAHCLAKSADKLVRISATASLIARVAVPTLSSFTVMLAV